MCLNEKDSASLNVGTLYRTKEIVSEYGLHMVTWDGGAAWSSHYSLTLNETHEVT